jgi:hypothetical protein
MIRGNLVRQLLGLALLFCMAVGCKTLSSIAKPTVLTSRDNKFQITVPAGWRTSSELHDKAGIQAANKFKELYVIVLSEDQNDFAGEMTLDKFTEITRNSLMSKYQSPRATDVETISISGNDARQYELRGTSENIAVVFIVTTVRTPTHYHQILAWTLPSKWGENKDVLKEVTESFRLAS